MATWDVEAAELERLLEVLAGVSGAPWDDWDRDAVRFGLADAPAGYEYGLYGAAPVRLRLARAGERVTVTAEAAPETEARLARVEVTPEAERWRRLGRAFREVPRPERFIHHPGCPECEGYDRLLQGRDWETLTHHDVRDNWSPLGFLRADGFRYWLPAVLRLLVEEDPEGEATRLGEYLEDPYHPRFSLLTAEERVAVAEFLQQAAWWRPDLSETPEGQRWFERVIRAWERQALGVEP